MPILYSRNAAERRVIIKVVGRFTRDDIEGVVRRLLDDGAWTYGVLADERLAEGSVTSADIRAMAEIVADLVAIHGPRGPVALVGRRGTLAMLQLYSRLAEEKNSLVGVFDNVPAATMWLTKWQRVFNSDRAS